MHPKHVLKHLTKIDQSFLPSLPPFNDQKLMTRPIDACFIHYLF